MNTPKLPLLDQAVAIHPEASGLRSGCRGASNPAPETPPVLLEVRPTLFSIASKTPFDPRLHNNLGFVASDMGEIAAAKCHLEEALRLDPDYAAALETSCWLYLQTGESDKARSLYTRLRRVAPDSDGAKRLEGKIGG
ncbi:MAG: tetratricopeptide repeat protein [Bacteroidia bacterium]